MPAFTGPPQGEVVPRLHIQQLSHSSFLNLTLVRRKTGLINHISLQNFPFNQLPQNVGAFLFNRVSE